MMKLSFFIKLFLTSIAIISFSTSVSCGRKPSFNVDEQNKQSSNVIGAEEDINHNISCPHCGSPDCPNEGQCPHCDDPNCPNNNQGCDPNDQNCPDSGEEGGEGTEPNLDLLEPVVMELDLEINGKVDILWLVDGSSSMQEEQTYLGTNFSGFISELDKTGTDFQLAVSTLDSCDNVIPDDLALRLCPAEYGGSPETHLRGTFRGDAGHQVLKKGDPELFTRFSNYTAIGVQNSNFEHGLKSADLALHKVISGENEALLRNDAFLAVILVTDEEDDGIGLGMIDAFSGYNFVADGFTTFRYTDDDFINYLSVLKGAGRFSVSAITGTREANGDLCSAPHSKPKEEGTQYINAAEKTGGIIHSICETNWNEALAKIGMDMNSQMNQIVLSEKPAIPSKISVWVDGAAITDFTYASGTNSIKFGSSSIPPAGAHIMIQFYKYKS